MLFIFSDEDLKEVAKYRSRNRIPVLSWIHPGNPRSQPKLFSFQLHLLYLKGDFGKEINILPSVYKQN